MREIIIFSTIFFLIISSICYLGNMCYAADDDVPRVYVIINHNN